MHRKVLVFIVNDRREALLLKVVKKRGATWQPVTGSVDEGEDFQEAAERELWEETGLKLSAQAIPLEFQFGDRWGRDVVEKIYWVQTKGKPKIKIDPKEHTEAQWFSWDELQKESFAFPAHFKVFQEVLKLYA
jgi:8-oxo-dGTP pyrophosphatase MutT (NUDIX family)